MKVCVLLRKGCEDLRAVVERGCRNHIMHSKVGSSRQRRAWLDHSCQIPHAQRLIRRCPDEHVWRYHLQREHPAVVANKSAEFQNDMFDMNNGDTE